MLVPPVFADFLAAYYIFTTSPFLSTNNYQAQRTFYFDESNRSPKQDNWKLNRRSFGRIPDESRLG